MIPSRRCPSALAGVGRDERELEARKARKHLVRADGVEGGELGEDEDGYLMQASWQAWSQRHPARLAHVPHRPDAYAPCALGVVGGPLIFASAIFVLFGVYEAGHLERG